MQIGFGFGDTRVGMLYTYSDVTQINTNVCHKTLKFLRVIKEDYNKSFNEVICEISNDFKRVI